MWNFFLVFVLCSITLPAAAAPNSLPMQPTDSVSDWICSSAEGDLQFRIALIFRHNNPFWSLLKDLPTAAPIFLDEYGDYERQQSLFKAHCLEGKACGQEQILLSYHGADPTVASATVVMPGSPVLREVNCISLRYTAYDQLNYKPSFGPQIFAEVAKRLRIEGLPVGWRFLGPELAQRLGFAKLPARKCAERVRGVI